MEPGDILKPASVILGAAAASKTDILKAAARALAAASSSPMTSIAAALSAREALGSTGVGAGIALPHARLRGVAGTHAVFLRLASPCPFDSIDRAPVDLVLALVAPDEPAADLLSAVSIFSRVLRDAGRADQLRRALAPDQARMVLLGPAS